MNLIPGFKLDPPFSARPNTPVTGIPVSGPVGVLPAGEFLTKDCNAVEEVR
jgi:hypothetical protein